ncbi:Golgi transport complex subunit 1 [Terramyces sp. JEL0728]|nr:Golgi transport complex subunit 1 [Terramyces sp. JEL0728]
MDEDKVDAEILFQKHNVDELHTILLKIKGDADRKKQDLRTMVGDSYRDVIDAADAVGQMKKSTEELIGTFKSIQDICKQSHTSVVGSKNESTLPGKITLYPIAAQIRLLVITPEHIWNATEGCNFVTASRFYMIAKLVYSNIQSSNESMVAKFKTNFPVVKRQWEAIAPLQGQIVEKALAAIRIKDIRQDKLLDALASIGILKNKTEADLLQLYLNQRKKSILGQLELHLDQTDLLSQQLLEVNDILKFTFDSLFSVFYSTSGSTALKKYLPSVVDSRTDVSMSTFVKVYAENANMSLLFRYLPASVKKYHPTMNTSGALDNSNVVQTCSKWIEDINSAIGLRLASLLANINNGTDLIEISSAVFKNIQSNFDTNEGWTTLSTHIFSNRISVWSLIYHKKFIQCSTAIIENVFRNLFTSTLAIVVNHLKNISLSPEKDVGEFIWSQKLGNFTHQNSSIEIIGQTQTPLIADIEAKIQHSATLIQKDIQSMIKFFTEITVNLESEKNTFISKDLEQLSFATQKSFEFALDSYIHYLSNLLLEIERESATNQELIHYRMIFIGRIAKVVLDISKDLLVMFETRNLFENVKADSHVSEVHILASGLDDLYIRSHKPWIDFVSVRLHNYVLHNLESINWKSCIQFRSLWEESTSESSPTIYTLPVHPSNYLTTALFDISKAINRVDGYNMDKRCILMLLEASFKQIANALTDFFNKGLPRSSDGDLQLFFDIVFISKTIGQAGTDIPDVNERRGNISKEVEILVRKNVEKHYLKSLALLNPIFISHPKPLEAPKSKIGTVQEQHHLVPLAATVPRFTLLPITTPSHLSTYSKPSIAIPSQSSVKIRSKPESIIKLRTLRSSNSDVPLGVSDNSSGGRVLDIMNAVAGLSQPQKASDLLTNASSFLSGVWGSTSSPKPNSGRTFK